MWLESFELASELFLEASVELVLFDELVDGGSLGSLEFSE